MDRQQYVRLLHARIEHVDAALQRALGVDYGRLGKKHVEVLKGAAGRIAEGAEDDWHHHREDVERSLQELAEELEAHESVPHEAAESVKDGALELFRGEPSEILRRAEAVLEKARKLRGE